jgi:thioester reductase-like protein
MDDLEHVRPHAPETALVTGATGFVGRELLHALLDAHPAVRVLALVRAPDDVALARRTRALVGGLTPAQAARIHAVRGDMTAPRLGLGEHDWAQVLGRVDRVLHCAASIRFDLPLDVARRENVESTRTVLGLCRTLRARGRTGRLDHVSTAFVAGRRDGLVGEEELCVGQSFRNTYEQTKLEAEALCREVRDELPIVIHRPSIVVGRQSSGETSSYKAVYAPMRLLIRAYDTCPSVLNRLVPLPLPPDLRVDLVPVDYVASAIAALWSRDDVVGRCFHLAAGVDGAATLREIADLTCDHFDAPRLRIRRPGRGLRRLGRLVAPLMGPVAPRALAVASILFDYGLGMPSFDTSATRAAGLPAPAVMRYFDRILSFATASDFGRRPVAVRRGAASERLAARPSPVERLPERSRTAPIDLLAREQRVALHATGGDWSVRALTGYTGTVDDTRRRPCDGRRRVGELRFGACWWCRSCPHPAARIWRRAGRNAAST